MDDSFSKGLRLIEVLAEAEQPLGLTEVAQKCGLLKSHAHKFLRILISRSYVQQKEERGRYELTFKLWQLGSRALAHADMIAAARDEMQELVSRTRESATLAVYDQGDAVYIYKVEGSHEVRVLTEVGRRRPAHCVAAGKVLLAYGADPLFVKIPPRLKRFTGRTLSSADALRKQLAKIRQQGYAVNWGEWLDTVRGLAAPIFGDNGQIVAALNLSIPAERLNEPAVKKIAPLVVATAGKISAGLGYVPPRSPSPPVPSAKR
jgi:DNA-binding IclR family transcriptional regulator